ncbi:MAG: DUF732 domain-containing protein [Mycobacterium sp.]
MKRLLLLAGLTTMIGLAAPAHADLAADTGIDGPFLATLAGAGLTHHGSDRSAISAGLAVCQLMDAGMSSMDTVTAVQTTNPGFTLEDAARFAAISATNYCPQHM